MGILKVVVAVRVDDTAGPESEEAIMSCVVSTTTVPTPDSRRRKRNLCPEMPEPAVSMVVVRVPWVHVESRRGEA